jgi:hypothetical protein
MRKKKNRRIPVVAKHDREYLQEGGLKIDRIFIVAMIVLVLAALLMPVIILYI